MKKNISPLKSVVENLRTYHEALSPQSEAKEPLGRHDTSLLGWDHGLINLRFYQFPDPLLAASPHVILGSPLQLGQQDVPPSPDLEAPRTLEQLLDSPTFGGSFKCLINE